MNSYYTDDIAQRLVILWVMALLVLYANNAPRIDEDEGGFPAIRTTVGAYICARFTTACVFLLSSFASHYHRTQARLMFAFMLVGLLLTTPLFFENVTLHAKISVVAVVIVYQEVTWAVTLSPWLKKKLHLTYSTASDISHEVDRMAGFFIIVGSPFFKPKSASNVGIDPRRVPLQRYRRRSNQHWPHLWVCQSSLHAHHSVLPELAVRRW